MTSNDFLFDKKIDQLSQPLTPPTRNNTNSNSLTEDTSISSSDIPLKYTPDIPLPLYYQIPSKNRNIIFLLMVLLSIISAMDNGIVPAATTTIRTELGIGDTELGFFGSADYFGRLIGAICIFSLINKLNRKYLFLGAVAIKTFALCANGIITKFSVLLVLRGIAGISQVFFTIYFPVWCDQYGLPNKKTMMITIIQLGVPLGVVLGFILCTILEQRWILSFELEALCVFLIFIALIFSPNKFFSNTSPKQKKNNVNNVQPIKEIHIKERSLLVNIISILKEPLFTFTCLSNSIAFFTMGSIQFWGADYMLNYLKVTDSNTRMVTFSILCITGPTLGVIIGGIVGSCIGGYESKNSILCCIFFCVLSTISAIPLCLAGLVTFCFCSWVFLFFTGAMMPLETGITISSLPPELRGDASSVMNFILNLLGNLPPGFIYGIISNSYGLKAAMTACTHYSSIGVVFISIAAIFRMNRKSEDPNRNTISMRNPTMESVSSTGSEDDLVMIEERITNRISNSIAQIYSGYTKNSINN